MMDYFDGGAGSDAGYDIVHDCDDFVIVDKYPGIDFHSNDMEPGLFTRVKASLNCETLFPVHRLDKITSGLVVFAKTAEVNRELCLQFAERKTEKYYLALAVGKPKKKQGAIVGDMGRGRRGAWMLLKSMLNPARTQFFSFGLGSGLRLYLLKPYSGKTHQLRVALKSIGAPILGDSLYAGDESIIWQGEKQRADRAYLHAFALAFSVGGVRHQFVCPPRRGVFFEQSAKEIKKLSEPWLQPWPKMAVPAVSSMQDNTDDMA